MLNGRQRKHPLANKWEAEEASTPPPRLSRAYEGAKFRHVLPHLGYFPRYVFIFLCKQQKAREKLIEMEWTDGYK